MGWDLKCRAAHPYQNDRQVTSPHPRVVIKCSLCIRQVEKLYARKSTCGLNEYKVKISFFYLGLVVT